MARFQPARRESLLPTHLLPMNYGTGPERHGIALHVPADAPSTLVAGVSCPFLELSTT